MRMTVIRNIVRNASAHAAPGTLEIASAGHGLVFSDDGPGVSQVDAPHLFDRYYSTRRFDVTPGEERAPRQGEVGLGLAIAKRVCLVQGGGRSEEGRVGQGCVGRCRSRWLRSH